MIRKATLLRALAALPDEFSIDELFDRLLLIQKVEMAQAQSKEGKGYSEEEARKLVKRWSK